MLICICEFNLLVLYACKILEFCLYWSILYDFLKTNHSHRLFKSDFTATSRVFKLDTLKYKYGKNEVS